MTDKLFTHFYGGHFGPYGTNEGDIWTGEHSEVGQRLLEEKGLILIHEIMNRNGRLQDCNYCVDKDNPDLEMQMLIKHAREGLKKWIAAQAKHN